MILFIFLYCRIKILLCLLFRVFEMIRLCVFKEFRIIFQFKFLILDFVSCSMEMDRSVNQICMGVFHFIVSRRKGLFFSTIKVFIMFCSVDTSACFIDIWRKRVQSKSIRSTFMIEVWEKLWFNCIVGICDMIIGNWLKYLLLLPCIQRAFRDVLERCLYQDWGSFFCWVRNFTTTISDWRTWIVRSMTRLIICSKYTLHILGLSGKILLFSDHLCSAIDHM